MPNRMSHTVLIVDDHELFGVSLCEALCARGLAAHEMAPRHPREIVRRAEELDVDLVVLDLNLGEDADGEPMRGADAVAVLRQAGRPVLIVTGSRDMPGTAAAIAAGAVGLVPKTSSFDVLLEAVQVAAGGHSVMNDIERETWLARHQILLERDRALSDQLGQLSPREREVLELLAQGLRPAAVAERFVVSLGTVRAQIRSVLGKLGVNSQLEAVAVLREGQERLPS